MINTITKAVVKLKGLGAEPKYLYLSYTAHASLVEQLNQRDGRKLKSRNVFEFMGMKVKIDPFCPENGAYVSAEELK